MPQMAKETSSGKDMSESKVVFQQSTLRNAQTTTSYKTDWLQCILCQCTRRNTKCSRSDRQFGQGNVT
eukprot:4564042-Ditylum_brightwellii.AAC.1